MDFKFQFLNPICNVDKFCVRNIASQLGRVNEILENEADICDIVSRTKTKVENAIIAFPERPNIVFI